MSRPRDNVGRETADREVRMKLKAFAELARSSASEWSDDNASRLSAALAYYTIFSLAPLLVIIMAIVGLVLGREQAGGQVAQQLESVLGPQMASVVQGIVQSASRPGSGIVAGIIGFIVLVVGASGVFYELHSSLNTIWDVQRKSAKGVMGVIRTRLPSFLIIFVVGLLLLVALALSAAISAFGHFFGAAVPGMSYLLQGANFILSFVVLGLLFAIIFKMLPDANIRWGDVWVGAGATSLLFVIGKLLIGLYLGRSTVASPYGAAGSLVILLAFIYYSAQIFFLGAEFTQIYANKFGSRIVPAAEGQPMPGEKPGDAAYPSSPEHGQGDGSARRPRAAAAASAGIQASGSRSEQEAQPIPPASWRLAMASFIGGIFAGMFLIRPHKPA